MKGLIPSRESQISLKSDDFHVNCLRFLNDRNLEVVCSFGFRNSRYSEQFIKFISWEIEACRSVMGTA